MPIFELVPLREVRTRRILRGASQDPTLWQRPLEELWEGSEAGSYPIDIPCSSRHRAEAHSPSITDTVGYSVSDQLPALQASLGTKAQHCAQFRSGSSDL